MKLQVRDIDFHNKTRILLEQVQVVVDSYDMPITVRQVFYRLVAKGILPNTQKSYKKVSNLVSAGRYAGMIDWDKIDDETRGARKPSDWPDIQSCLDSAVNQFRLDRWVNTGRYVEVWVEKRTMGGVLYPTTKKYDVQLVIGGGFNSTTAIWEAVRRLHDKKDIHILYMGDYDPSGDFMSTDIENRIREFGIDMSIKRILLNKEHIKKYNLPPAFKVLTKKQNGEIYDKLEADPRAKGFKKKHGKLMQVEIESLDPGDLVGELERAILELVPISEYNAALKEEDRQREKVRAYLLQNAINMNG